MRAPHLSLVILLGMAPLACTGMGGSEALGGPGTPTSFAVTDRFPTGGAAGVPVTASVVVTFNVNIDPSSVALGVVALNGATFGTLSVNGAKLTFTPAGELDPGTKYSIDLSPDLRGSNGHLLGPTDAWGFKTAGSPPPDTLPTSAPRRR